MSIERLKEDLEKYRMAYDKLEKESFAQDDEIKELKTEKAENIPKIQALCQEVADLRDQISGKHKPIPQADHELLVSHSKYIERKTEEATVRDADCCDTCRYTRVDFVCTDAVYCQMRDGYFLKTKICGHFKKKEIEKK